MADGVTKEFRTTLGMFATGVTVVTSRGGDHAHGMTANTFTSVSLDPLLILVCVERSAVLHKVLGAVGSFGVSMLAADQHQLASWFASSARPMGMAQFGGVDWWEGPLTSAPMLASALAWLECRVHATYDGGDHDIIVGRVVSMARGERQDPLLFFGGGYRMLDGRPPAGG